MVYAMWQNVEFSEDTIRKLTILRYSNIKTYLGGSANESDFENRRNGMWHV